MSRQSTILFGLLTVMALLMAACGPAAPASAPAAVPTATVAVEPTTAPAAVEPTAAPVAVEPTVAPVAGGLRTFVIMPDESTASYIVDEEFFADALSKYGINAGRQDTIGSTQQIQGQLQLNLDDLAAALGDNSFTVDLSTLESDQGLRDGWLRRNGPQFGTYPQAAFVGTAIEGAPTSYTEGEEVNFTLIGDMTIREITQPATFDVTATLEGDTIRGTAIASMIMSSFGIEPPSFANTLTVKDEFRILVDFVAQE